ncbi:MAG: hypothetical protein COY58_09025 [Gammaproteobacteria bacterium CG_4_10_14_0_8_um_filter_38_16]|nr:MAG: hypothetical protein COY58_09025 [Gammaproteobacteria bacterium CG_4_10_14_0_8_um_filter_38_16]PJA03384.1 MAG: hypothetical protein COX72_05460 [Gammaproteobacteria bacterium CG_4_10_14_0_2_um_filter_38_22]
MLFSYRLKPYWFPVVATTAIFFSANAFAGGFQLWEQNAGDSGDYHAGAAAETNSVANVFYNAAIAAKIKHQQFSFGGALIALTTNFTGTADGTPVNNVSGDTTNIVPNFSYVLPFKSRWAFAFSVTTPFGLATKYPNEQPVNFLATKTELQTFNLNPSVAYQINRDLSVGVGFDVLYGSAIYNADIFQPIKDDLSGVGYGYNAGLLAQITNKTRVGLSYRSGITIDAKGPSQSADFFGNPINRTTTADFPLPPTTILSVYQNINSHFTLMATAFYTQWSVFHELIIHNLATPTGTGTIRLLENYRDTWNLAIGGKYKFNHHVALLAGFGHDDTPTRILYRDIRLPDNDHYAVSLGIDIQPQPGFLWSLGWTHFFIPTTDVNNSSSNNGSTIAPVIGIGTVKGDVNVLGIQFTCDI